MTEEWRPVVGYEGSYEVSDLGNVRSLDRPSFRRGRHLRGQPMTPAPMGPSGYLLVSLWRDGQQSTALVHRLVLAAFVGPAPDGHEALHRDGVPSNNQLTNLSWGTHAENQADQVSHGTHPHASKTTCPVGHPYDDLNTYIYPGRPHRGCRTCRRDHMRDYKQRKAA